MVTTISLSKQNICLYLIKISLLKCHFIKGYKYMYPAKGSTHESAYEFTMSAIAEQVAAGLILIKLTFWIISFKLQYI
jgi:hypothetical protein